ncbi:MAG: T9SS type A sorting domain-containing protein, partial [Candidatus Marinimicrobia bacterium]|nr:T9SS type A sorting domain-containing protein [Candidatus Neomarinimicrobiota bacterium]
SLTNLVGAASAADTMNAPAGRYFYLLSREAFVTPTATHFGALKLISEHCEIYIAENVWGTRITMDDVLKLAETFEDRTPMDSTRGIKAIVDEWHGEVKDTDGNGKIIIFLADILDEYDLGRNDTNDSFFENGYVAMGDTTDAAYSNQGDIIYLDVDPQVIGTPPYTTWNHSMLHALAYQYAHMAALHNKPTQEPWIRYGVALKLQEMVAGNVKFFGDGANTKATAANELTYINANLLKSRDDLFNVYNFFTYLTEKYSDPDDPLAVIRAIAASDELGVAAVDEAIAQFDESTTTAEAFSNYGTACFLDMVQDSTGTADDVDSLYNGIYSFDALLLNAPPSGKNAGNIPWDKAANNGAPFPKSGIFPWSFNFYVSRAYFLNLEGQVIIVSPDLQPEDTLIFDGYDGITYKAKKIMLRSGYLDPMTQDFEVVDFELDDATSRGTIPVSTDSRFRFRDTYPDTLTGSQLLALVVSKTDYAQPPVTYDFVLTNITSKPEFGDFYTLQNPDADTYLDLFIVSQRALYDLTGTEGAKVQVNGEFDTTTVTMEKLHDFGPQASVYSGKYELTAEGSYDLLFTGQDQNGISLDPVTRSISVGLAKPASATRMTLPSDLGQIDIPSHAVENDRWVVGGSFKMTGGMSFMQLPQFSGSVYPVSDVIYTANTPFKLKRTATLTLSLTTEQLNSPSPLGVYLMIDGNWEYIGGQVSRSSQTITVNTNYLGRYVVAAGEHGQVYQASIVPETYVLEQNYPNPFNPSTTISFGLPEDGVVSLKVYDIQGREVVTLAQNHFTAGTYQVTWNALDAGHSPVASGVYFYVLDSENFRQVKKMVLTK